MSDAARDARAKARASWPVTRHSLNEPPSDVVRTASPSERVAMVWALTVDAWTLSGRPIPDYPRSEAPGRILRGRR